MTVITVQRTCRSVASLTSEYPEAFAAIPEDKRINMQVNADQKK
jgi:hypothetical protein